MAGMEQREQRSKGQSEAKAGPPPQQTATLSTGRPSFIFAFYEHHFRPLATT